MQIWASFILLQVLHGSEDKGKTNLIRTMRPHMLCFLLSLLLYLITDFTPVFHQLLRFVCWSSDIFACLLQPGSLYLHFFLSEFGPWGDLGTPGRVIIQNLRARVRNTQPEAQISGWGSPMRRKGGHELGLFKIKGVSAQERICSGSPGIRMWAGQEVSGKT